MKKWKKIIFAFLLIFSFYFGNTQKVISQSDITTSSIEKTESENFYYYEVKDSKNDLKYSWKYIKETNPNISLKESLALEPDLKITIDDESSAKKNIERLTKEKKIVISFTRYASLPTEITAELNVSNQFQDGEKLYLYYYNKQEDKIEYVQNKIPVKNGKSTITVSKCADYFLTNKRIKNATNNPKKRNYIIISLILISFLLLSITFLEIRKK